MDEMLETMQDANASEGMEDTDFLAGLMGEEEVETEEEERDANEPNPSGPKDGTEGEIPADDAKDAEKEPEEKETGGTGDGKTESAAARDSRGDEPKEEPFLEINFLGEKKPLTREEAKELAEKGSNLDHVREKLQEAQGQVSRLEAELIAPRAEAALTPLLRAYAKAAGGDLKTLTGQMMEAVKKAGVNIEQPAARNFLREKAAKDWEAFFKAFPEVRDPKSELPEQVWDRIRLGVTPQNALIEHRQEELRRQITERDQQIQELKEKVATMEAARVKNEENKKRSGSPLRSSAPKVEDDFLGGFLGI